MKDALKKYSVRQQDIRVGDIMVKVMDHKRKEIELMLKVDFPASDIKNHHQEIADRIKKTLDYLQWEGFFPEESTVDDGYKVKFHFFHAVNRGE